MLRRCVCQIAGSGLRAQGAEAIVSSKGDWPREKRWKDLYTRSVKVARARQLGIGYPRVTSGQPLPGQGEPVSTEKLNVLFVCSRNQWRSPTAEEIWRKHPSLSVRSAGTSASARRKLSAADIQWADVIFVMEEKHRSRLISDFQRLVQHTPVHVLDIPDEYRYMDAELVELLRTSVAALLGLT
jgi:predicted protein tyrosine phosphatase